MPEVGRQRKNQPINGDDHCCGNDIPILNADLQLWTKEESHQS